MTKKKNKNRHHKLVCQSEECGFSCRASNGPVEEFGYPWHCEKEMVSDAPDEEVEPVEPEEELQPMTHEEEEEEDIDNSEPIEPDPEVIRKAAKAANDKASLIRRTEKRDKAEADRVAELSDVPFSPLIGQPFYVYHQHTKTTGAIVTATPTTLMRRQDGDRFEFSEDGGEMWRQGMYIEAPIK